MMIRNPQTALRFAATEPMDHIRRDLRRAPERLKPLLAFIRDHLFEAQLDVNYLKKSCGVRDNSVPIRFHSVVGQPPHRYIEDRRLETACRLLVHSDLKIWQIASVLGYSSIQVFSRAFGRWAGERPTSYRKQERRRQDPNGHGAQPGSDSLSPEILRKALRGELDSETASAVIDQVRRQYPTAGALLASGQNRSHGLHGSSILESSNGSS